MVSGDGRKVFAMDHWKNLPMHPVVELFPEMSEEDFASLEEDIEENGLKEPITLFNGAIVDGRHRYRACVAKDVTPYFRNFIGEEEDLKPFVFALNLHRRHLDKDQKELMAVNLRKEGWTQDQIAKALRVSIGSVNGWLKDKFKNENTENRIDKAGRTRPTSYNRNEKEEDPEEKIERLREEAADDLREWVNKYAQDLSDDLDVIVDMVLNEKLGTPKAKGKTKGKRGSSPGRGGE